MEEVYFYESGKKANVEKILGTDEFMRVSFTTKESINENRKSINYIYIIGSQEELNSLEAKFNKLGVEKSSDENKEIIINKFKQEAENAASGMGLIFG
jgi:hypothetical protein